MGDEYNLAEVFECAPRVANFMRFEKRRDVTALHVKDRSEEGFPRDTASGLAINFS